MSSLRTTLLLLLALCITVVTTTSTAYAQSTSAVRVRVIIGNTQDTHIDSALRKDATTLREEFPQFSHFEQAKDTTLTLAPATPQSLTLPGNKKASLTLENRQKNQLRILVKVPGGETRLTGSQGGTMFVGGPRAPNGIIILWIEILS